MRGEAAPIRRLLPLLIAALPASAGAQQIAFKDVGHAAGLGKIVYQGSPWYSAAVAFVDLDGDGWADLYFGGVKGSRDQFCRNRRDGTFDCAPIDLFGDNPADVLAIAAGDYDRDGDLDLYVMREEGGNSLLENDGQAHFSDVTKATRSAGNGYPTPTGTFFDYDGDGRLDLYLGHWYGSEITVEAEDQLLHQEADGTFRDATAAAGIVDQDRSTLAMIAFDYDGDGRDDLYVSNDFADALLFHNQGGYFRDVTALQSYAVQHAVSEGMGIDVADVDGDGRVDLYVTGNKYQDGATNDALGAALLVNQGDGTFISRGPALGVDTGFSWGTGLVDFDGDTWPDIFVATNFIDHYTLYRNEGGRAFSEIDLPGLESDTNYCVTAAFADYDNDGKVDVVLHRIDGHAPQLLHNETVTDNHWLQVRLRTGHDEIGAKVTVAVPGRSQTRELLSQTSKGSQSDRRFTFGLGEAVAAHVSVRFPDGQALDVGEVSADREVVIDRAGLVLPMTWKPAPPAPPMVAGCALGPRGGAAHLLWLVGLLLLLVLRRRS